MGTYYIVADENRREYIEPAEVFPGGIKYGALILGDTCKLLMHQMMQGRWKTPRIVSDSNDEEYHSICEKWTNITKRAIDEYNEYAGEDFPHVCWLDPSK